VCKAGGQRRKKRKDTTAAAASEKRETSPVEEENSTPHIQRLSFRLTLTDSLSHLSLPLPNIGRGERFEEHPMKI